MTYTELLRTSAEKNGNILCMGLDPKPEMLPAAYRRNLFCYFSELIDAMVSRNLRPAAFKPNIGYWASLDRPLDGCFSGSTNLAMTLSVISEAFPGTPIILDSKRGDIAASSANYAAEAFDSWGADACTVAPYMGSDSVGPFTDRTPGKGVYILCRTSNPGGRDLQNLIVGDTPLYLTVARKIREWKGGAVVGATNMDELKAIVSYLADDPVPLLVPGVGSQGGSAGEVIAALDEAGYPRYLVRINSSSGLTHPWKKAPAPENWKEMCLASIARLLEETAL